MIEIVDTQGRIIGLFDPEKARCRDLLEDAHHNKPFNVMLLPRSSDRAGRLQPGMIGIDEVYTAVTLRWREVRIYDAEDAGWYTSRWYVMPNAGNDLTDEVWKSKGFVRIDPAGWVR